MTPEQRKHFEWVRDNMHGEKPEQEPVALEPVWGGGLTNKDCEDAMRIRRLSELTTPPQRTWVGLTDEEMRELWENRGWYVTMFKAVEAKLKEKNT